jgi:TolB-like protein
VNWSPGRDHRKDLGQGCFPGHRQQYQCGHPEDPAGFEGRSGAAALRPDHHRKGLSFCRSSGLNLPSIEKKVEFEEAARPEGTPQPLPRQNAPAFCRSRWKLLLVAILVAILAGVAYFLRSRAASNTAAGQKRVMLAVLPFANLSNDPQQEYFSDGLTEETITDVGEVNPEKLSVIARTCAMAYKNTNKTVNQIGHELGVDYVLEGSVRRGGTARITAQLIRVSDQSHLWAHNYEREVGGILALQKSWAEPLRNKSR